MAQGHRGLCGWSLMAFFFLSNSFLFTGCCENVKPDRPSCHTGIHGRPETSANLKCRTGLEMMPKIPCNHVPATSSTSVRPVSEEFSSPNAKLRSCNDFYTGDVIESVDHSVQQIGADTAAHLVGLGCRLRGGSKSHRTKCSHQGCKGLYMALAGDCPYCTNRFCMAHRLPEDHKCCNLAVCKEEAFASNARKLHTEAKGVHVRPESIVRGETTD